MSLPSSPGLQAPDGRWGSRGSLLASPTAQPGLPSGGVSSCAGGDRGPTCSPAACVAGPGPPLPAHPPDSAVYAVSSTGLQTTGLWEPLMGEETETILSSHLHSFSFFSDGPGETALLTLFGVWGVAS